jgi:putative proteasome-type protease
MTYCLGIQVEEGLIGIADTRILSGNECRVAQKTWVHEADQQCMFVMTSGLRSLRDKVLVNYQEHLQEHAGSYDRLFKAVNAFGAEVRKASSEDSPALTEAGLQFNLHAIIGGQFGGDKTHMLYLVYPQGNWVEVGTETPFEIIGNSGYGKPILERSIKFQDPLRFAFKVGFLSFDSSRLCAADVGYPVDVMLYPTNSFRISQHRYDEDDLKDLSTWWQERLRRSVSEIPAERIEAAFSKLSEPVDATK